MALESLINAANEQYKAKGIAAVSKRPTPVKIMRTQGSRIVHAVLESPSTVDYHGVYPGHALEFDAKSTREKTRFPLQNVHPHQIEHLRLCESMGAICFLLVEFAQHAHIFYVPAQLVTRAYDASLRGGAKSIPYEDIARTCYVVEAGRGVVLDYLAAVD